MENMWRLYCFLYEWDSRAEDKHYKPKGWLMRENLFPGEKFVRNQPLVKQKDFVTVNTY
jgi:hypothetical protein